MNDEHPYQELGLDEILQITASDAAHAPQLREQGKGLKALADRLDKSVDAMLLARASAETGFEGRSASELHERATGLVTRGSEGHAALRDQPEIFFALSDQAEATHQRMLELRGERDAKLEQAPPDERAGIRESYTVQARDYMRETTSGYVKALRRSDWMTGYNGPRVPRDGEAGGPKGFVDHNTPGPSLNGFDIGGGGGPQLQSGPTLAPELGNNLNNGGTGHGPVLKQQSWIAFGSVGVKNGRNPKKKRKDTERHDGKTDFDGPVKRDVLPPVIGSRPEPEMAAVEPAPAPRSDATVPSVIGSRESAIAAEQREPLPRNDGLVSPVIGMRPGMMGGMGMGPMVGGGAPAPQGSAPSRPQPAPVVRRSFATNTAAGVRSAGQPQPQLQHSAEGRVFRSEPAPGAPETVRDDGPAASAPYTRAPKPVHGGPDNVNRAVIRNSRAFARPPADESPSRETEPEQQWRRAPEEPEFETGPFITHYNLGRSQ